MITGFISDGSVYLDNLAVSPRAVLSLRKLHSSAGNCLRVRRSSDNTEQDIGFVGDQVDSASAITFAAGSSLFVKTWYDQSGNGEDANQTTSSKQPRIANSGVWDGKLVFDGTDDSMSISALNLGGPHAAIYAKHHYANTTSTRVNYELSANYGSNVGALVAHQDSNNAQTLGVNGAVAFAGRFPQIGTTLVQTSWLYQMAAADGTTNQQRAWVTGSAQTRSGTSGTAATPTVNFGTTYDFYMGGRAGTSLFTPLNVETLVIYNVDTTTDRASIEGLIA